MLPLLGEKPESRIHRWCAGCLRDYKEQRSRPEAMAFGAAQRAMSPAALDALERYSFSEEHDEQQQEQQEMSSRTADDEAAEDVLKDCRRCGLFKPLKDFYGRPHGSFDTSAYCKPCCKFKTRKRKHDGDEPCLQPSPEDEEEGLTLSAAVTPQSPPPARVDLYVMQNSRIAGELKIGRSCDVELRRRSLQASHNFTMVLLAVFPCAGHIETSVHAILNYCRITEDAAGREWFACTPQTAFAAIGQALGAATATCAGSSA